MRTEPLDQPPPPAPAHLSDESAALWDATVTEYDLAPWALAVLRHALEANDTSIGANAILARDGLMAPTVHGEGMKQHPMVAVARDARAACARLLAQLGLGIVNPGDPGDVDG